MIGKNFLKRLKEGLSKTSKNLSGGIEKIFAGKKRIDDEFIEELEETLIAADIGFNTGSKLIKKTLENDFAATDAESFKKALTKEMLALFNSLKKYEKKKTEVKPNVIMIVGVNGVGKTTTIGKLAYKYFKENKKTLIAAADTFRAAAIEQLCVWAERADADIVKHHHNSDPSAVVYDSVKAAIARNKDVVIVDTAGRLHTQKNLMEELKKIKRTIGKVLPGAPNEILLVLDATTGQNALSQAKTFNEALNITSLALTKLDGTAKGGIVLSIADNVKLPLKYIGIGEQIEDLQEFDAENFVASLLEIKNNKE
ncbi:MAG: signal recognition particle-docking protein FtsY [Deltaproteobacteria bacterium]|nr:signal recognition particle-docking protein FtsY [Deltaproteobacteria bacterium]